MKFTISNHEQRSPEWYAARVGRLTGSRAGDMTATIKSGEAAARRDLRTQLVLERLSGKSMDENDFVSKDMQRGIDLEAQAFAEFEAHTGTILHRAGFLSADDFLAGCSLDGYVGTPDNIEEIAEIKCPKPAIHLQSIRTGKIPKAYLDQCRHNAWISGAKLVHFFSYNADVPREIALFHVELLRKDLDIEGYQNLAFAFMREVDAELAEVRAMIEARRAGKP